MTDRPLLLLHYLALPNETIACPAAHVFHAVAKSRCALELPRVADPEERELKRKAWWDSIHELNRFVPQSCVCFCSFN